jgi:hypothetical protein
MLVSYHITIRRHNPEDLDEEHEIPSWTQTFVSLSERFISKKKWLYLMIQESEIT